MKIFDLPFQIANEVVKRNKSDNRRFRNTKKNAGNDFFYLGRDKVFSEKFANFNELTTQLKRIKELLIDSTRKPIAVQNNEGILVQHKINKKSLLLLLPFLKSFLLEYKNTYHNPNLEYDLVKEKLNNIEGEYLIFYSDLVYIHDNNSVKPYFKWFTQKHTSENWKLLQEFLIPKLSFLNFEFENYQNDIFEVNWELTYAPVVIYSSNNIEDIISNSVEKLISDEKERETIKEAITKIRIGQSQFRKDILSSENNKCLFTNIKDSKLLIASHIKPWKVSSNTERLDLNNGLLLTPTFDKLFDRFLITFSETGDLVWTKRRLTDEIIEILKAGITVSEDLLININENNRIYFEFHRQKFEELEEENI